MGNRGQCGGRASGQDCSKIDVTIHKDSSVTVQITDEEFRQEMHKNGNSYTAGRIYDSACRR